MTRLTWRDRVALVGRAIAGYRPASEPEPVSGTTYRLDDEPLRGLRMVWLVQDGRLLYATADGLLVDGLSRLGRQAPGGRPLAIAPRVVVEDGADPASWLVQ